MEEVKVKYKYDKIIWKNWKMYYRKSKKTRIIMNWKKIMKYTRISEDLNKLIKRYTKENDLNESELFAKAVDEYIKNN